MPSPIRSDKARLSDDEGTEETKADPLLIREQQPNLRYIFFTSFILVVVSCYAYPYLFIRQDKRH